MPFSLYVHFPFCHNKCSYCDYYKELFNQSLEKKFYEALKIETALAHQEMKNQGYTDFEISTIFIGGGTPSLTNIDYFSDWLKHLRKFFKVPKGIEFSIESNPESITSEKLQIYKKLGVTRPTFGFQTFNEKMLKVLDRKHNREDSHKAVYFTNTLGFKQFGVDLIFGLPGQTAKMLSADIDQLLDLEPPHISFYQLIIEEGTPFADRYAAGEIEIPTQEVLLAMYRSGTQKFQSAGYTRYEISSFAKPGFECRHNINYWNGGDYLGLGPSAHSFINGERFYNWPNITEYIDAIKNNQLPRTIDESGFEERMTEAILLGLRTMWGVSRKRFEKKFGIPLDDRLDKKQFDIFVKSGHIIEENDIVKLTESGVYVVEEITRRLLK